MLIRIGYVVLSLDRQYLPCTATVMLLMVMMVVFMLHMGQLSLNARMAFHSLQKLRSGQFIPGSSNQCGIGIMLSQQRHSGIQFRLGDGIGTGQDDGGSSFDLVVVELTEVLAVDLYLSCIHHGNGIAQGRGASRDSTGFGALEEGLISS